MRAFIHGTHIMKVIKRMMMMLMCHSIVHVSVQNPCFLSFNISLCVVFVLVSFYSHCSHPDDNRSKRSLSTQLTHREMKDLQQPQQIQEHPIPWKESWSRKTWSAFCHKTLPKQENKDVPSWDACNVLLDFGLYYHTPHRHRSCSSSLCRHNHERIREPSGYETLGNIVE